jgi:predicted RNase H-like HicB family nuclease
MVNLELYPYKITLKKWKDEDGEYFVAKVPELDGCKSSGATIKEALRSIKEAMIGYIEVKIEFGDYLPIPLNDKAIVELQGEYSEQEKEECYQAVDKMRALIDELNL